MMSKVQKQITSLENLLGQAVLVKTTEPYPHNYYAGVLERYDGKIFVLSLWSNKNTCSDYHEGPTISLSPTPNFGGLKSTQRNKQKLRRERDPITDLILLKDKVVGVYRFTNVFERETDGRFQRYKGYEI
ncbi:hypothetical protein HZA97_09725 [Candidatus Woesearchaeota archaeon]|nr:hypothetical protein [Candidatus Woesearchaeota archaeon]